jgi:exopolysaccharide production protein ExoQ
MFKFLEKPFVVAMLFYTTGALLQILTPRLSGYSGLGPNAVAFAIQGVVYACVFCFIGTRWRRVLQSAWKVKWILALLLIASASIGWSQDSTLTLRRVVVLFATTAFGVYFATRFDVSDQLRLLAWTCGLVVCASFLCGFLLPQYGIDQGLHYGDWQGAFHQKNMLARAMVLAILVFLFARFRSGNALRWVGLGGALTLLVLSRSVTGLFVLAAILALWPLYRVFRTRFTVAAPTIIVTVMAAVTVSALAYVELPTLLEMLNRNEGLTGRVDLWNAVWLSISKQPLLGYGFDAFWQGIEGESANIVLAIGWVPAYAHNGFLDLVLGMGMTGLAVFAFGYFTLCRRAFHFLTNTQGPDAVWLCAYLAFMALYNITEGPVISQNNITWVLYVATAVSLAITWPAGEKQEEEVAS